jgi:hypothetical protein
LTTDLATARSRRAILGAALGGAAAALASTLGRPAAALAADGDPVVIGQTSSGTQTTGITGAMDPVVQVTATGAGTALQVSGVGIALSADSSADDPGIVATAARNMGIQGRSTSTDPDGDGAFRNTGVLGAAGDTTGMATNTNEVGVYGFSDTSAGSAGVWGDTGGGVGVVATGDWGIYATGRTGIVADVGPTGTAIYAFNGAVDAGDAPAGRAIYAKANSTSQVAFEAVGRVRFSRSGRVAISKGASSKVVTLSGVSTSSYVIATLQSNQSGLYVKCVVPATGKFTIVLSKACAASCVVGYFVIN